MANDLQSVADTAITRATVALRNNSVTARLVSNDYQSQAAQKNTTIQVPLFKPFTVVDITPGRGNEAAAQNIAPDNVDVVLDQWKGVPFMLTDKEIAEVEEGRVLPEAMERATIAIADTIDLFILRGLYRGAYSTVTATSSAALTDLINLKKILNQNKVRRDRERYAMFSDQIAAEFSALGIFADASVAGTNEDLIEGTLGRRQGFQMYDNGQMPTHTIGNASGWSVNGNQTASPTLSGGTSVVALTAGTGNFKAGDLITFASHSQVYSVQKDTSGSGSVEIAPRLQGNIANTEAVSYAATISATHAIGGLAWHRSAYAFATRPLQTQRAPGAIISQATDPVSGLSMRVTLTYVNHALYWEFDILYGGRIIYPEAVVRLRD